MAPRMAPQETLTGGLGRLQKTHGHHSATETWLVPAKEMWEGKQRGEGGSVQRS